MANPVPTLGTQLTVQPVRLPRAFGLVELSDATKQASQEAFGLAAQHIKRSAFEAGRAHGRGADPFALQLSDDETLAAEAFNKGAVLASGLKLDMHLDKEIERISGESYADPNLARAKLEAFRDGTVPLLPSAMQDYAEQRIQEQGSALVRGAHKEWEIQTQDANRATALEALDAKKQRILAASYSGQDPSGLIDAAMRDLQAFSPAGPMGKYAPFSLAQMAEQAMHLNDDVITATWAGRIQRATPAGKVALLNDLDSRIKSGNPGMDVAKAIQLRDGVEAKIKSDAAEWRAATNFKNSQNDRLEAESYRKFKLDQDAAAKEGDLLQATGGMTREWVVQNRDRLSNADFRHFLKPPSDALNTDPSTYVDLFERSRRANTPAEKQMVAEDTRKAYTSGQMRREDHDRLRQMQDEGPPKPLWFKQGDDFISQALQVSALTPDPIQTYRKALALQNWDQWARAHPDADWQEAEKAYGSIVTEWSYTNRASATNQISVKKKPIYWTGSRIEPDIKQMMEDTKNAYDSGLIDSKTFAEQIALIQEWNILSQEAAKVFKP
jgi:hypothetical protein